MSTGTVPSIVPTAKNSVTMLPTITGLRKPSLLTDYGGLISTYALGSDAQPLDPFVFASTKLDVDDATKTKLVRSIQTGDISLDKILEDTTIKRACCMRKRTGDGKFEDSAYVDIQVKIPLGYKMVDGKLVTEPWTTRPSGLELTDEEKTGQFYFKQVRVPKVLMDKYDKYKPLSAECNNFMELYCTNAKQEYIRNNGDTDGSYEAIDFAVVQPDCACYNKTAEELFDITPERLEENPSLANIINAPRKCYMDMCNDPIKAYPDPSSQLSSVQCADNVICMVVSNLIANNNSGDITTGGQKAAQNCSSSSTSVTPPTTPAPAQPSTPAQTPTPSTQPSTINQTPTPAVPAQPSTPAQTPTPSTTVQPSTINQTPTPSTPPNTDTEEETPEASNAKTYAIIGGVVGGVVCLCICIILIIVAIFVMRKK